MNVAIKGYHDGPCSEETIFYLDCGDDYKTLHM